MKLDLQKAEALAEEFVTAYLAGDDPKGLIMRAVAEHGAIWGKGDPDRLTIYGVATSCTYGAHGLLSNWVSAVRRKAAKAGA